MTSSIATIPGLQPFVQLGAFTSGIPVPGSLWDTVTWDSPAAVWEGGQGYIDPPWLDITCDVNAVEINTGRDRSIDRWQVGNATLTLNNATGWADVLPWSNDSLAFEVRPGRQIRFGVSVDGAAPRWLYRWFIDSVDPAYEPMQESDIVTVACVDAKGQVGKISVAETATPVGAGDTPNVRINRVLDAVSWPPGARDIVPSGVPLIETSFGTQVVDVIDRAADSAAGVVYGDSIGRIAYREIDWQNWPYDAGVDASIGNGLIYPVPGWLTPKIGQARANPPDLTGMSAVTITAKVNKTDLTTALISTIAAVMGTHPAGPMSWRFYFGSTNGLGWGWSTDGMDTIDVQEILTAAEIAAAFESNVDFHIGVQINFAADTLQAITSTDGTTWTALGSPKSAALVPPFNAATPLEIGAQHVGTYHVWDGRIYWVEMRTGLNPTAGTLLWRFDANDYPGFGVGSYTDPRGRPWTVTGHGAITLGTAPSATADVCPVGWELSFDLTDIATQVHVGRSGQPPQILNDTPNQIRYGVETFTRTDLESSYDPHITAIGQQLLKALSADFMPNVAAVTIDASTSVPARDLCVTVDPTAPSRYHCRLHRANGRVVFDREFLAVGVQHRIDPTGWETRIALDDAAPYMIPGPLLSAEWDSAHWNEEAWH